MTLTRLERKFLNGIVKRRDANVSLFRTLRSFLGIWLILVLLIAGSAFCFWNLGLVTAFWLLIGGACGVVIRDIGWVNTGHRLRHVLEKIIDYGRVEALLAEEKEAHNKAMDQSSARDKLR